MRDNLVKALLNKNVSVRETIDRFAVTEGPLLDLADAVSTEDDSVSDEELDATDDSVPDATDEFPVKMLFVRRFHEGDEKPVKRIKCSSVSEAIKLFLEWSLKYKNDRLEIWTSTAADAKNFYRYVLKNRSAIEPLWKSNYRLKKLMPWTSAYRDVQQRSRQAGSNLVGTLDPFNVPGK